jgi:hypothetical protein
VTALGIDVECTVVEHTVIEADPTVSRDRFRRTHLAGNSRIDTFAAVGDPEPIRCPSITVGDPPMV